MNRQERPKTTQKFSISHAQYAFKPEDVGVNSETNEPYCMSIISKTGMRPLSQSQRVEWQRYIKKKALPTEKNKGQINQYGYVLQKNELFKVDPPDRLKKNSRNPKKPHFHNDIPGGDKSLDLNLLHFIEKTKKKSIQQKNQQENSDNNKQQSQNGQRKLQTSKSLQKMFIQFKKEEQLHKIMMTKETKEENDKLYGLNQSIYREVREINKQLKGLYEKERVKNQLLGKDNSKLKGQVNRFQFQLKMQMQTNIDHLNMQERMKKMFRQQLNLSFLKKQQNRSDNNRQKQVLSKEKQQLINRCKQLQHLSHEYIDKLQLLTKDKKQSEIKSQLTIDRLTKDLQMKRQQLSKIQQYNINQKAILSTKQRQEDQDKNRQLFISKLIIANNLNTFLLDNIQRITKKRIKNTDLIFKKDEFRLNIAPYINRQPFPLIIIMKTEDNCIFGGFSSRVITENARIQEGQDINFLFNASRRVVFEKYKEKERSAKIDGLSFYENYLRFGNNELCLKNNFIHQIKVLMGSTFGQKYYSIFNRKDLTGSSEEVLRLKELQIHEIQFQ